MSISGSKKVGAEDRSRGGLKGQENAGVRTKLWRIVKVEWYLLCIGDDSGVRERCNGDDCRVYGQCGVDIY